MPPSRCHKHTSNIQRPISRNTARHLNGTCVNSKLNLYIKVACAMLSYQWFINALWSTVYNITMWFNHRENYASRSIIFYHWIRSNFCHLHCYTESMVTKHSNGDVTSSRTHKIALTANDRSIIWNNSSTAQRAVTSQKPWNRSG
jgi:hypothetical protein